MTGEDLLWVFDPKGWDDVRRILFAYLAKAYGGRVSTEDLEDAVQTTLTHMWDYWLEAPASVSPDPARNFRYALTFGRWYTRTFLRQIVETRSRELPSGSFGGEDKRFIVDDLPMKESRHQLGIRPIFGCDPDPAVIVVEEDETERARKLLDALETEKYPELAPWLRDYLDGKTEQESARKQKVTQQAISKRRRSGLPRLRRRAKEEGLD